MSRIVLDIETLAYPLDRFDQEQQEYLFKFASTEEERTEVLQRLNLYPLTARILALGLLDPETGRGTVRFEARLEHPFTSADGAIAFVPTEEVRMLEEFWAEVADYDQVITFNGRSFDCPFLLLRSALLGIVPSRNLMPYRYDPSLHCDLLEQFTYYGVTRKFSLDFYCKAFGVDSPKAHGITGHSLAQLVEEGRYRDIAEYCARDLSATAELFRRWNTTLHLQD